jgi:hypothetical protein
MLTVVIIQAQWQPDFRLTNDNSGSWTSGNPISANNVWCVAANGNNLHVVWYDYRNDAGTGEIFYKRSVDGGLSWGNDIRLTNDPAVSENPSIAVSGSVVHVVWQDKRDGNVEIYCKNSNDGGTNWSADTRLTNDLANSLDPSVAVFGSVVHVVWQDNRDGNYEIYYKSSTNGGSTWGADTRLTNDVGNSSRPVAAVSGSNIHVAWNDNRDGNDEIYYKHSTDGGITWSVDKRLTIDPAISQYPTIAVSGAVVHVVWNDVRDGNYEIYYKNSTDGGVNWSADKRLTNDANGSLHTSVAVCGSAVHIVWYDNRDKNFEIYYKNSTDAGLTWSIDTRLTNNAANSWFPSVAISSSGVHVLWTEERDGNDEIYYKRNSTGCNPITGSLCGTKYNDLNGNGLMDAGEPGIPNWQININNPEVQPVITDKAGNYCFENLPAWPYIVSEVAQKGWHQTGPVFPGTYLVVLSDGQIIKNLNFGNRAIYTGFCTDFENNSSGGWQVNNALMSILTVQNNHFIQTTDMSGSSYFFNESSSYTGNWGDLLTDSCGSLCFDINYLYNGDPFNGTNPPITMTPSIGITGNGFSASFIAANPITVGDGWHTICAPLRYLNSDGTMPSNAVGHWVMTVGTPANWSSLLSNVTRVVLPVDPTSYQNERFGFDNICTKNSGDCKPPTPFCDLLSATAKRTNDVDCCWSISLNQPSNMTGISSIQFQALAPNQFTTGTGLGANFQTWFTSGANTYTPPTGVFPGGNLNNFFNLCLTYVTTPQLVVVNWLNSKGNVVCSDTVKLDCRVACVTFAKQTITCAGSNYNVSYIFTNNASYSMSNISYTVQSPTGVTITPSIATLAPVVLSGATSNTQNIVISGTNPGDIVTVLIKFSSPDGCCWCYETKKIIIPSCATVCDSVSVYAKGSPTNCCYSVTLVNNSSTVFSNIEFALLSGGMYSTTATTSVPGWGFTNIFPNNLVNLVKFPISMGIGTGTFSNILNLCIRQYLNPTQKIEVRWIKAGRIICRDTLKFECLTPEVVTDPCSQVIKDTIFCLPDGTFQYNFQIQNNSSITSTGYGIFPTTTGAIFSQTIQNISIMPGQVSPIQTIIISGIGQLQSLCFQTSIFTTIVPGENVYNYCCHSDTVCIKTPDCRILPGSICGFKFNDLNGNGLMDKGEPVLPNWVINLTGLTNMSAVTDDNGKYCFTNLKPGKYTVSEVAQSGWTQTAPTTGTFSITLASGQNVINLNFGNMKDPIHDCVKAPTGMVAWWPLDETSVTLSGLISKDLAGFNNIGTRINGPVPVSAKVLGGLQLDGIDDYVEVPDHIELNFGKGDFSIDAWIQTTDISGSKDLVDKRTSVNGIITGYSFFLINGNLSLQLADGSFTNYGSPVLVANGKWNHIAVTVSRADPKGIHFYLNGADTQFGDPTLHQGSLDNKNVLRIGNQSFSDGFLFKGILDEIEMFNRVITKAEIVSIFEAGSAGKCKPIVGIENDIQGNLKQQIHIYPNPASTVLNIRFNSSIHQEAILIIRNILGVELVSKRIENGETGIDVSRLQNGFYFVTISTDSKQVYRTNLIIVK